MSRWWARCSPAQRKARAKVFLYRGRSYKGYRGMGSVGAMARGSADRYFQAEVTETLKLVARRVSKVGVPYKGPAGTVVHQGLLGAARGDGLHRLPDDRRLPCPGEVRAHHRRGPARKPCPRHHRDPRSAQLSWRPVIDAVRAPSGCHRNSRLAWQDRPTARPFPTRLVPRAPLCRVQGPPRNWRTRIHDPTPPRASLAWRMGSDSPRALVIASMLADAENPESCFTGAAYACRVRSITPELAAIAKPTELIPRFSCAANSPEFLESLNSPRAFGDALIEEMRACSSSAPRLICASTHSRRRATKCLRP